MDDGLAPKAEEFGIRGRVCLNPCCSGRWSRTVIARGMYADDPS